MGQLQKLDELGNRMKAYEKVETGRVLDKTLPVYARLDGRGFSKFTKNMERPFDIAMSNNMIEVTKFLMTETHANIGFTQSDEISLVWKPTVAETSNIMFDGKVQKLTSVLASMATSKFTNGLTQELRDKYPHFDCRIINVPDLSEATNMIVWREIDARKNAISMLARSFFPHKMLQGKSGKEMLYMLAEKNIFMTTYPNAFKNGTLLKRVTVETELTEDELKDIPEKFRPTGKVKRTVIDTLDVSPLSKREDKVSILFEKGN